MAVVLLAGCDALSQSGRLRSAATKHQQKSLSEARKGFVTKIVKSGERGGPPDAPTGNEFQLIQYSSPVGPLAAYITPDPGDGQKRPAVVWITGGDNNSIGDVWTPNDRSNDQTASAFRKAGIVLMFPSQRGGNNNPGQREGFFGEVDDILAATDYLAALPYVDRAQRDCGNGEGRMLFAPRGSNKPAQGGAARLSPLGWHVIACSFCPLLKSSVELGTRANVGQIFVAVQ